MTDRPHGQHRRDPVRRRPFGANSSRIVPSWPIRSSAAPSRTESRGGAKRPRRYPIQSGTPGPDSSWLSALACRWGSK